MDDLRLGLRLILPGVIGRVWTKTVSKSIDSHVTPLTWGMIGLVWISRRPVAGLFVLRIILFRGHGGAD